MFEGEEDAQRWGGRRGGPRERMRRCRKGGRRRAARGASRMRHISLPHITHCSSHSAPNTLVPHTSHTIPCALPPALPQVRGPAGGGHGPRAAGVLHPAPRAARLLRGPGARRRVPQGPGGAWWAWWEGATNAAAAAAAAPHPATTRFLPERKSPQPPQPPQPTQFPHTPLPPRRSTQGYGCRLEPQGSLLIPPDFNVGVTDWERSMRLREGRFAVLEAEPPSQVRGEGCECMRCECEAGARAAWVAEWPG